MNKKGLEWRYLILGIIAIAVVVITIFFFTPQISKLFAFFKPNFEDLSISEKSKIEANFNQLIENIKACRDFDDSECLCSVFPDFPSTFPKECQLEIEQKDKDAEINLLFNEKKALGASIENINLSTVEYSLEGWVEVTSLKKLKKKILDFEMIELEKEFYPFFHLKVKLPTSVITLKGRLPAITDKIYKGRDKVGFVVSPIATSGGVEEQKSAVAKFPSCLPKRLNAIDEFDKVINALKKGEERELTIELPQDYRMWIFGKGNIVLQYKKGEKGELVQKYGETILEKSVHEVFTFDIKCKESTEDVFLLGGDKIKIKKTANAACIEKI